MFHAHTGMRHDALLWNDYKLLALIILFTAEAVGAFDGGLCTVLAGIVKYHCGKRVARGVLEGEWGA